VEGDTFDINGRRMFEAETTKYVVINRCGDTVTTREIFMPQATFIGRTKGAQSEESIITLWALILLQEKKADIMNVSTVIKLMNRL
jgi:hypothetical protein